MPATNKKAEPYDSEPLSHCTGSAAKPHEAAKNKTTQPAQAKGLSRATRPTYSTRNSSWYRKMGMTSAHMAKVTARVWNRKLPTPMVASRPLSRWVVQGEAPLGGGGGGRGPDRGAEPLAIQIKGGEGAGGHAPRLLQPVQLSRHHGRVREVREHAVDAQLEELQVLVDRVARVVAGQAALLVAEGPGVHLQAGGVGALDQVGGLAQLQAGFAGAAALGVGQRGHDVALPGADAVGVRGHFFQAGVRGQPGEGARQQLGLARCGPVVGAVIGCGEV